MERVDGGHERERDEIRAFLREWQVAGAPPEIEARLRRTFRRQRSRRGPIVGLAAAAVLLVGVSLAVTQLGRDGRVAPKRIVVSAPPPSLTPSMKTRDAGSAGARPRAARSRRAASETRPAATVTEAGPRRSTRASHLEAVVIVEPRQAELLLEFVGHVGDMQQVVPPPLDHLAEGVRLVAAPAAPPPAQYDERWVTVTVWPLVQRPF